MLEKASAKGLKNGRTQPQRIRPTLGYKPEGRLSPTEGEVQKPYNFPFEGVLLELRVDFAGQGRDVLAHRLVGNEHHHRHR